jgi:hypothetical protein
MTAHEKWHERTRRLRAPLLAALILALSGCMTFELEAAAVEAGHGMSAASTSETVHGSWWGFKWSDHVVEKGAEGDYGLYRVEYHTNALFSVVSVLTLGLYVPQTVEWWTLVESRDDKDTKVFVPSTVE